MSFRHYVGPVLALAFVLQTPAFANTSTFSWSTSYLGFNIGGTASFSTVADATSGFDLVIVLTNTATDAVVNPGQVLAGLAFDITSGASGALSMLSAQTTGGLIQSTNYTTPAAGSAGANICAAGSGGTGGASPACSSTISGGWEAAYSSGGINSTWAPNDRWGIGTTGLGVYNGNNVNPGDYGLVPGGGVGAGANGAVTNGFPYVYGSATFTLRGLTSSEITVSNVEGIYGTQPEATPAGTVVNTATPEPSTLSAMGLGAALLGFAARKRRATVR
jgi:hypothetical protein